MPCETSSVVPQERRGRGGEFSHLSGESEGGSAVQLITIISMSPIPGLILRNVMRNSTQGKLLHELGRGQLTKDVCNLTVSQKILSPA